MSFEDVNFLAVGLATVLTFALGGLWYSPVMFARRWTAAHGFSDAQIAAIQSGGDAPAYATSFVCWLVMATVFALVGPHFGDGVGPMLHTGLLLWLGFTATVTLSQNRFSFKPLAVWLIDTGYQIASICIMAVVLGLWR